MILIDFEIQSFSSFEKLLHPRKLDTKDHLGKNLLFGFATDKNEHYNYDGKKLPSERMIMNYILEPIEMQ